jgi:hypothetical protein
MEKGKEFLAKIIDREREFLISEKYVFIGRSDLKEFSQEVGGKIIFSNNFFIPLNFSLCRIFK